MADCERCGGACCESFTLEIDPTNIDFKRFIELRSTPMPNNARNFDCPCLMLKDGRCMIYERRPNVCRVFEPGGGLCQSTVRARRSPEEAAAILGEVTT